MNRRFAFPILIALIQVVCQQSLFAQEVAVKRSSNQATPEESRAKIEAALSVVIDMDFFDEPLTGVAELISKEFGFPVVLDENGMDLNGVTPDDTITLKISGVRLRTALDLLFQQKDLTYILQDDVYVITSLEAAGEKLETRVYDVTRFVSGASDNSIVARTRKPASSDNRVDALEDLIRSIIIPDSWDEYGGTGTMSTLVTPQDRYLLTVSQPEEVHYRIKKLFESFDDWQAKTKASSQQASKLPVRVYPIAKDVVSVDEARQVLELALEEVNWKEPAYLKVIGGTLVIKQNQEIHSQIGRILDDMGALPSEKSND